MTWEMCISGELNRRNTSATTNTSKSLLKHGMIM